jgi:hypothetical protein
MMDALELVSCMGSKGLKLMRYKGQFAFGGTRKSHSQFKKMRLSALADSSFSIAAAWCDRVTVFLLPKLLGLSERRIFRVGQEV